MVHHPITRERVMARARFGWEFGTMAFDQQAAHTASGYRTDAAGFVSMCYDIPLDAPHSMRGLSTITLLTDGWFVELPSWHELLPGDLIGNLGLGSLDADGGTVVIFEEWLGGNKENGYAVTIEHLAISAPGPARRARALDHRWHSYRYVNLVERPAPDSEQHEGLSRAIAVQLDEL